VANQRSLLKEFARNKKIEVYDEYVDDGWSGTSFERPAFKRLLRDIENGVVNMVITKDMSRLGRDYILTGYYIERYFPEKRVRYISILDGIDTEKEGGANDLTPFRAIMNDMYAKDISRKITSVKRDKQRRGLFIGGKAAYGYMISKTKKNTLIPNADAAKIVNRIFKMAAAGESCRAIALALNEKGVPSPSVYAGLPQQGSGKWSGERIAEMIRNPVYIGHMAQGKTRKISYKSRRSLKVSRDNWIIVKNTHEPLVDKSLFQKAGLMLKSRERTRERRYEYILKGIAVCKECARPLGVINRPDRLGNEVLYFVCRTYQRGGVEACTSHCVKVDAVTDVVMGALHEVIAPYLNKESLLQYIEKKASEKPVAKRQGVVRKDVSEINADYADMVGGEGFCGVHGDIKTINANSTIDKRLKDGASALERLADKFVYNWKSDRQLIATFIKRAELSEDRSVTIHFRCVKPFLSGCLH
jgi:site-specific DNA recombinase